MDSLRPYKQILNFLTDIIEQVSFEPNYKLPSERMLAIKFGASRRSIRIAYEHLLAQGMIYKMHGKGYFTTGRQKGLPQDGLLSAKKISFIVPAMRTLFMQDILYGITDFCDEHSLDVSIKFSKGDLEKETQYIRSAFHSDVKGIILFPLDNEVNNSELLKLSANRYPIAIIDRYFKNVNSSFISTDNHNAMVEAIKFLHSKKHKKLLYLTSPDSLATSVSERLNGYLDGMAKYYKETDGQSVVTVKNFSFREVYDSVTAYLKKNPQTDVIITSGVQTATDAIISSVTKLKRSIPKDIKLMIFDSDFSSTEIQLIQPYVIQQNAYQIGYQSAATLYNQIYGDLHTTAIRLPVRIIDYTKKSEKQKLLL